MRHPVYLLLTALAIFAGIAGYIHLVVQQPAPVPVEPSQPAPPAPKPKPHKPNR